MLAEWPAFGSFTVPGRQSDRRGQQTRAGRARLSARHRTLIEFCTSCLNVMSECPQSGCDPQLAGIDHDAQRGRSPFPSSRNNRERSVNPQRRPKPKSREYLRVHPSSERCTFVYFAEIMSSTRNRLAVRLFLSLS
jgi:hypothetical protein